MTKHEMKQERAQFAIPTFPEMGALPDVMMKSVEAYQKAVVDWQTELSTFIADRIQQDVESLQALAEERSFSALLKVQQEWFSAAMRDYTEESRKLMEIASRIATAGLSGGKGQAAKAETRSAA